MAMDTFPILPDHYVTRTVNDMNEGEICYILSKYLLVDYKTHQPYIDKYVPITIDDSEPTRLLGRLGVMRVFAGKLLESVATDGYIIDVRMLDEYDVVPDTLHPDEDDSPDRVSQLNDNMKNLIAPIGIIAVDEDGKEQTYVNDAALHGPIMTLLDHTDELQAKLTQARRLAPSRARNFRGPRTSGTAQSFDAAKTMDSEQTE